jgi:hypothetical protein
MRGDEIEQLKYETPSISCLEDRGRPKSLCSRDQLIDGLPILAEPLD